MAKEKDYRFKRKGEKIGQPNAEIEKVKVPKISSTKTINPASAPFTYPAEATASDLESINNGGASRGKEKERENNKCLSGFIFMCNPSTKLECYQYRVFGLPLGRKEVVEEIKPGTKLFLFDFELKLLYGIYEATSAGNLNLEPAAFRGKFPAQVKFRIFKECLPLPETSIRHVIKENYTGSKFKQELSKKQVRKLLSSFHPLFASSSQTATQALTNVSLSCAMPPSAMENHFKHTGRLPVVEVPYIAEMQYSHIRPFVESQPVPVVNCLQLEYHRTAAYAEHVHPTLDHRNLPATSSYYVANAQRPFCTEGVAHGVQEPPYSRYITMEQRAPPDDISILERQYHQLPREALHQDNLAAYNYNPSATVQYTLSVMPTQVPAPCHPLPLQRDAQYQDSVVAYSSNHAAVAQYAASVSQPQFPTCNSDTAVPAQYTSSVTQPEVLAHAAITSYYSYSAAERLSHRS